MICDDRCPVCGERGHREPLPGLLICPRIVGANWYVEVAPPGRKVVPPQLEDEAAKAMGRTDT